MNPQRTTGAEPCRLPLVGHAPAFLHDKLGFLERCAHPGVILRPKHDLFTRLADRTR